MTMVVSISTKSIFFNFSTKLLTLNKNNLNLERNLKKLYEWYNQTKRSRLDGYTANELVVNFYLILKKNPNCGLWSKSNLVQNGKGLT